MPEPRPCAMCGKQILWCETVNGGIVALDAEPNETGDYRIVAGKAVLIAANLHILQAPMLSGPRHSNHVVTCKPPEGSKHKKPS